MNTRKMIIVFTLVLAIVSLGIVAWAGEQSMMPAKANPKASGKLNLSNDKIQLKADGLKPNSVYTVWFVNMKPKKSQAGAGTPPYMFKTDSQGKGSYEAALKESPIGKWQMVMVMLHPGGDPMDMKNMVEALSAKVVGPAKPEQPTGEKPKPEHPTGGAQPKSEHPK